MRFTKPVGRTDTLRKVWNNDKSEQYGVVGTVGDMLKEGILEWCEYSPDTWCFLPCKAIHTGGHFGKTREEALTVICESL